jgi:hypothetical protein
MQPSRTPWALSTVLRWPLGKSKSAAKARGTAVRNPTSANEGNGTGMFLRRA